MYLVLWNVSWLQSRLKSGASSPWRAQWKSRRKEKQNCTKILHFMRFTGFRLNCWHNLKFLLSPSFFPFRLLFQVDFVLQLLFCLQCCLLTEFFCYLVFLRASLTRVLTRVTFSLFHFPRQSFGCDMHSDMPRILVLYFNNLTHSPKCDNFCLICC